MKAASNNLVLLFVADVQERLPWAVTDEISEFGFFPLDALPEPMSDNTRLRFHDIAAGETSIVRTMTTPGVVCEERSPSQTPQVAR